MTLPGRSDVSQGVAEPCRLQMCAVFGESKCPENLDVSVSAQKVVCGGCGGTHCTMCPALNTDGGAVVGRMVITNGWDSRQICCHIFHTQNERINSEV